ncbi:MAG: hypothetical protein BWZ10_02672 [candidate division BRC1 bacterium ADurb.BinA364]|nr:MAG: hypothetical protein BWZ10_02672 [candidate division BRC1 bacterium ADurb.BinA364]
MAPEKADSSVKSPVRITIDGRDGVPDASGAYWDIQGPVAQKPSAIIRVSPEMGAFQSCTINVYATSDGQEAGRPWAITDYGAAVQALAPNRPIALARPDGATIVAPDGQRADSIKFESGKTYIALFAVDCAERDYTIKARFRIG